MASDETENPAMIVEDVDSIDQEGADGPDTRVLIRKENTHDLTNQNENVRGSLSRINGVVSKVTVGGNKGKIRLRSTQELREMLEKKTTVAPEYPAIAEEKADDDGWLEGQISRTDGVIPTTMTEKFAIRRFSNQVRNKTQLGYERARSKSDNTIPRIRTEIPEEGGGGSRETSRRLRSRRRRRYAQETGLDIENNEDEDEDEQDPDIHAGRVRRGSILIPGISKTRYRGRQRTGSQDLIIEESIEEVFGDDEMETGSRRGSRSQLLINTVVKGDPDSRRRRPRSRRSSSLDNDFLNQRKLQPANGRFLLLPGSSRRSRRGSVSDVDDEDDDVEFSRMSVRGEGGKRGGFLSTGTSGELQKPSREELRKKNAEKLLRKFRIYCKLITSFYRLCQQHFLSANNESSAFRGIHGLLDEPEQELLFDVRKFRANKESGISADSRRILSTHPKNRKEKDKYHVLISMRNFPTFCEYPLAMQQEIVGVGWYVSYQAQRIILRQGHWAENFYFILSGSVVVSVMDEGTHENRTVVYLKRGDTFGELGLVNRAKRQATVIARERVEMITITGNDYTRIFMAGGLSTLLNPQQNDNAFVRNLRFLDGWPLHRLAEHPKKCVFSYFKRGDILIRESRRSDWIIIVKSGSCQVMKLLRRARPKKRDVDQEESRKQAKSWSSRRISKSVDGSLIENFEQRKKREEFENFMKDLNEKEMENGSAASRGRKGDDNASDDSFEEELRDIDTDDELENAMRELDGTDALSISTPKSPASESENVPTKHKAAYMSRKRTKAPQGIPDEVFDEEAENGVEEGVNPIADILFLHNVQQKAEKQKSMYGKKKTLLDDIGGSDFEGIEVDGNTEPIWVRVQTLTKGSVFGLADMAYDSQPSFAVISNGAECILLSKKLYMEHATMRMISKLRTEYQRYPPEDELQAGLEVKLKWDIYKEETLKGTLEESKARDRASRFR
ncbi:uncharacterized protein [Diadema setosum]|uniref:uncharacterized protein n=1 Tax=Diadema setosum TaxID=31175 RepID=UPI003B3B1816